MEPSTSDINAEAYDKKANEWDSAMSANLGHIYIEKPAMKKLLPKNLEFKKVLCIGVGSGDELSEIIKLNPSGVVAIDISEKLLEIAFKKFPSVKFLKMDMMKMDFKDEEFDFVYSSLVFHYAYDWDILMHGVAKILKKDGLLLFSTHDPGYWGAKEKTGNEYINERGITLTEHKAFLPGEIEVIYYNHKNRESILESLNVNGFKVIESFPAPTAEPESYLNDKQREDYKNLKLRNDSSPLFFIVLASKK